MFIDRMAASQWPAGWHSGVLDPRGPVAAAERLVLLNATSIMLAVVIPVVIATLAVAWWFRGGNRRAVRLPDWSYSGSIELVVWSIPALVIFFLGGIAWIGSHDLDPRAPLPSDRAALSIEVVSLDWKWLFIYPDQGIATVGRVVVPAGTPIRFALTSGSVMNSFFIPQLGSQIYTMPGMTTHLNILADHPGKFAGLSAQFSGDGFSDMRFDVVALDPPEYAAWLGTTRAAGGRLDAARYQQLARPGTQREPLSFAAVAPELFEAVAHGAHPDMERH